MSDVPQAEAIQAQILDAAGRPTIDALHLRLAAQIAPRKWRRWLELLADQSERGQPLDEAYESQQDRLPSELRCLVAEALQVSDPTRLILEAIRGREQSRRNWRELLSIIIYPSLLYFLALAVSIMFSYVMQHTADFDWIDDFGLPYPQEVVVGLADQHHALLGLAIASVWLLMVLVTIALAGPPWAWLAVLGGMLLIGRSFRWNALQEVLHRLGMFVSQSSSTSLATAAVARSFQRSRQSVMAEAVNHRVQSGMPLGSALAASLLSDNLCRPALLSLDVRGADMQQALSETAEVVGHLAEQRFRSLAHLLPLFLMLLVGTLICAIIYSYFVALLPLVSLISSFA